MSDRGTFLPRKEDSEISLGVALLLNVGFLFILSY